MRMDPEIDRILAFIRDRLNELKTSKRGEITRIAKDIGLSQKKHGRLLK